jgi:protein O-GlcNAc transferase
MFSLFKKIVTKPTRSAFEENHDLAIQKKEEGDRHLSSGDLDNAEHCYRESYKYNNSYCDALINIGYVLTEKNRNTEAISYLEIARSLSPQNPDVFFLLGLANRKTGNIQAALNNYQAATRYKPDFESAHLERCQCLLHSNRLAEALDAIAAGAMACPTNPSIHYHHGNTLASLGKIDQAISAFEKCISIQPNFPEALANLATAHRFQENFEASLEYYQKAIRLQPTNSNLYVNIGDLLVKTGKLEPARESYEKAISIDSRNSSALTGIALLLHKSGNLSGAIDYHEKALAINSDSATSNCLYGITLQALGRLDNAVQAYSRAISINPEYAEAHNNLAGALHGKNDLNTAIKHLQMAIAIDPKYAEAHSNLGVALYEQGDVDESIASFYQALKANPNHIAAHSSLLFVLSFSQKHSPEEYLIEAKRFGEKVSKLVTQPLSTQPALKAKNTIRVGLVSGDLRVHPVGYFLESIIQHVNPDILELHAYPTNDQEDALSKRLKAHIRSWKPITWLSDESAARMIHDDGIDILIDLAGHSAHNRLPVFAWRPAPIQASWLGFFASTGVAEIDYILVDPNSVPPDGHTHYSETPCFLPETRLCFTAPNDTEAAAVTALPAQGNGYVTFGCFQNLTKLNDEVLKLWGRIAQAIPGAKFRFQIKQLNCAENQNSLRKRLEKFGISAERTTLLGPQSRADYLAAHANVDLILDTFPYPGGTTTCEALWMGVPTLTLLGNSMLSRQGSSIMSCAGLENWIASDQNAYLAKAIEFAEDVSYLADLRRGLRTKVASTPLFDAPRFAKVLEAKLSELYQNKLASSR